MVVFDQRFGLARDWKFAFPASIDWFGGPLPEFGQHQSKVNARSLTSGQWGLWDSASPATRYLDMAIGPATNSNEVG